MSQWPVTYTIIDEQQRDEYFRIGFNPPDSGYNEEEFFRERTQSLEKIKKAVAKHYVHGCTGNCEFFMSRDYFVSDRFLCIEVCKDEILTPKLLRTVHDAISKLDQDYSVDICNAFPLLRTPDGDLYPDFNIIVEKHRMLIYSESRSLFNKLMITKKGKKSERKKTPTNYKKISHDS